MLAAAMKAIIEVARRGYEKGHRVSDRQWNDILGVLKVQRAELEFNYLKEWARHAGVEKLLERAFEEAGIVL